MTDLLVRLNIMFVLLFGLKVQDLSIFKFMIVGIWRSCNEGDKSRWENVNLVTN